MLRLLNTSSKVAVYSNAAYGCQLYMHKTTMSLAMFVLAPSILCLSTLKLCRYTTLRLAIASQQIKNVSADRHKASA
jgi:hypothetical protein